MLTRFTELTRVNLSGNFIRKLPSNLSVLRVSELDLSGNPLEIALCVDTLKHMPLLSSLYIDLHEESHVDCLLRAMPLLKELNGIAVVKE